MLRRPGISVYLHYSHWGRKLPLCVQKETDVSLQRKEAEGRVATSCQDLIHTQGTFDPLGSEGSLIEMQKPKVKTM